MAAVDQYGQLDRLRAAGMEHRFDRCADCPPGVDDVIHQDHSLSGQVAGDFRPAGLRQGTQFCQVVTIKGDIDTADRNFFSLKPEHVVPQHGGQRDAAAVDAEQDQISGSVVLFDDLMGDPGHAAADRCLIHDD